MRTTYVIVITRTKAEVIRFNRSGSMDQTEHGQPTTHVQDARQLKRLDVRLRDCLCMDSEDQT